MTSDKPYFSRNSFHYVTATGFDIAPVSSKEFLDIQATMESRFTLKLVRDMIITYSLFTIFIRNTTATCNCLVDVLCKWLFKTSFRQH